MRMKKISIRITDQQYEFIESLVAMGDYANVSEVIREALRLFMNKKKKELKEIMGDEIKWMGENV
ncbi:type II toxin-antitoxin system ParD family antitoxin [Geoglobus sp.]